MKSSYHLSLYIVMISLSIFFSCTSHPPNLRYNWKFVLFNLFPFCPFLHPTPSDNHQFVLGTPGMLRADFLPLTEVAWFIGSLSNSS